MSRKQKAYRAWYHKADAEEMNVQSAFAAGWDAHKGVAHARTIQELQAENERLREDLTRYMTTVDVTGLQAMKADAERYRWLSQQVMDGFWACGPCEVIDSHGETYVDWSDGGSELDAAIDAAKEGGIRKDDIS